MLILMLFNPFKVQSTTGTFDVRNALVMNIENRRVCLSAEYVEGHVEPASSFILFRCSMTGTEHNGTIDQTAGCIAVDPNPSYTIIVTDADAEEDINVVAPVTITGVSVPDVTTTTSSTQNTVSSSNTGQYLQQYIALFDLCNPTISIN